MLQKHSQLNLLIPQQCSFKTIEEEYLLVLRILIKFLQ